MANTPKIKKTSMLEQAKNRISNLNRMPKKKNATKRSSVLYQLKQASTYSSTNCNESDYCMQYWNKKKNKRSGIKTRQSQYINVHVDNVKNGNLPFYDNYTFSDRINNLVDLLGQETFNGIEITRTKAATAEGEIVIKKYEEFQANDITLDFKVQEDALEELFKYAYLYGEAGLKIDIIGGKGVFVPMPPKMYAYDDSGYVHTINYVDGELVHNAIDLNGEGKNRPRFFVLNLDSRFYLKLEQLLKKDMVDTGIIAEVEINKSKIFTDRKMWGDNEISDIITLLDIPDSVKIGDTNTNGYFQVLQGKNSITEIIEAGRDMEHALASSFKVSRKMLGFDSAGIDYASSLPYENQMTAATINSFRRTLEVFISQMVSHLVGDGLTFDVDMSQYSLVSEEAIVRANKEALESGQMSIGTAVSKKNDLPEDDEFVRRETLTIKIEQNKTLTYAEELDAKELGLMPGANDEMSVEKFDFNEE